MYDVLLADDQVRLIFNRIRKQPGIRFRELERATGLHGPQVSRSLNRLKELGLIWPRSIPTQGSRVFFAYHLSPRGEQAAQFLTAIPTLIDDKEASAQRQRLAAWLDAPGTTSMMPPGR